MSQQMFCIKCGKEAIPGTVFCGDCISKGEQLASLPDMVAFELCPSCGKVKKGSSWMEVKDLREHILSELRKMVTVAPEASLTSFSASGLNSDENSSNVTLNLSLLTHGVRKDESLPVRVRVMGNTCPTCNRKSGHYFESTIQLRGEGRVRYEVIERVLSYARKLCDEYERSEKSFFVSSIKQTRGGVDIELSSNTIGAAVAKKVAQRFGADVVPTRKLFGRRNGKEVYRTTFLVRVAMFNPGDYVEHRGEYFRVSKSSETIVLNPLRGGMQLRIRPSDSTTLRLMGGKELEDWAEVISEESDCLLVRNPRTMETVRMPLISGYHRGSRIRVAHIGEEMVEIGRR